MRAYRSTVSFSDLYDVNLDPRPTLLHKADGVIREEHTYGKDPEKYPG